MFTTHKSKTLPSCLMLLALLAIATPAMAMNDPVTGRWITRDPTGFVDGANLYEFVGSNPPGNADPLGNAIIGISGWDRLSSGGKGQIREIGQRIKQAVNQWRSSTGLSDDSGGFRMLRGTEGMHINNLTSYVTEYRNRFKDATSEQCRKPSRFEGLVLFGYSDGATTIYQFFKRGLANKALRFEPRDNSPTSRYARVSFVGMIDMVRKDFDGLPNPFISEADRWLPSVRDESLVRDGATLYQNADAWLWPPCPIAARWKGYKDTGFNRFLSYVLKPTGNHCSIIEAQATQDLIVRLAVQAYKDHVTMQQIFFGEN